MDQLRISSILYSNDNFNLAYELKKKCRDNNVNLVNAKNVKELVKALNDTKICVVFIDSDTVNIDNTLLDVIKSYDGCSSLKVIDITSDIKNKKHKNCKVDYCLTKEELFLMCKDLIKSIKMEETLLGFESGDYSLGEINTFLTEYLLKQGFAPKHIGFTFIKHAIELAIKNGAMLPSLSRIVYPKVGAKFKTQPPNVERNIRNSIECACNTSNQMDNELKMLMTNGKISNRAFLSFLVDKVTNIYIDN